MPKARTTTVFFVSFIKKPLSRVSIVYAKEGEKSRGRRQGVIKEWYGEEVLFHRLSFDSMCRGDKIRSAITLFYLYSTLDMVYNILTS